MGRIASFAGLTCLVTGASSGIGREIARELARQGARLVVSARRQDRLVELCVELRTLGAPLAHHLAADLADAREVARLADEAEAAAGPIDVLVNNAGFAVPGQFQTSDVERTLAMLRVNAEAPVVLTRRLLPGMVARNRGGVLTVASVAGFNAAPYQSGYAGTKAFLLVWSASLHQEVKHTQVAVTALCPGVTDTEFFEAAGYTKMTGFLKWRASAAKVAKKGLAAFAKGKMEIVPGLLNKLLTIAPRFTTRRFAGSVSRRLMGGRSLPARRTPNSSGGPPPAPPAPAGKD